MVRDRSSRTWCPGSRAISWRKQSSASKLAVCRWCFIGTTTASARCPKARSPTPSSWRSCSKRRPGRPDLPLAGSVHSGVALSAGVGRAGRQGAVGRGVDGIARTPGTRVVDPVEQAIDGLVAEPATIAYTPGGTAHLRARGCRGRTRQPRRARSAALRDRRAGDRDRLGEGHLSVPRRRRPVVPALCRPLPLFRLRRPRLPHGLAGRSRGADQDRGRQAHP